MVPFRLDRFPAGATSAYRVIPELNRSGWQRSAVVWYWDGRTLRIESRENLQGESECLNGPIDSGALTVVLDHRDHVRPYP